MNAVFFLLLYRSEDKSLLYKIRKVKGTANFCFIAKQKLYSRGRSRFHIVQISKHIVLNLLFSVKSAFFIGKSWKSTKNHFQTWEQLWRSRPSRIHFHETASFLNIVKYPAKIYFIWSIVKYLIKTIICITFWSVIFP